MLYDRGLLSCFDAKTGQPFYLKERLPRGPGFTTSPWAAGDKIYCLDEDGQTHVLRAGDKFELLHTNPSLDSEMCMGTPALVGDRLILRTDRHLYSIRNPSRQP
ncbi:MAG: PQQ-like beta-propeller repeat protein [Verrucomicrobiaceae bacterium]|nr:PQQ-like beta-propeller repeat protein [Verrucomicrobiaceae bacterium]